jgi:lipid II:glycine glycyltransferase (peptidoglycan interpeptide bridge formation enzyme)
LDGNLSIWVARKDGIPIAAILTLQHRSSVVFKYGCSDEKVHKLGGMPFLFWRLIEDSKVAGFEKLDFGRSDLPSEGLITFKNRFGTERKLLTYYRYPDSEKSVMREPWVLRAARRLLPAIPDVVCSIAGRALYRHMG